jgi:hypothetical protein
MGWGGPFPIVGCWIGLGALGVGGAVMGAWVATGCFAAGGCVGGGI